MRLRELDDRFIPAAAARIRTWTTRFTGERSRIQAKKGGLTQVRLADLDSRYAGKGPLAIVREIPQAGFVLIAAVFLAGTATAVVRHQPAPHSAPAVDVTLGSQPAVPSGNRLGPDIGQTTEDYEKTSHEDLEKVAAHSPDASRLALVAFSDYRTPAQLATLLGSYDVRRVYLRARNAGPDAAQIPYEIKGELGASLQRAYADIALSRLELRRSYLAYVATTKNDKVYQADYQHYADSAGREVVAYQHLCACVFSAVIEAPASALLGLWTNLDIRSVQVADRGASMGKLLVTPVLPETTGLVTQGPPTPSPSP
ncbi:MAG: hypothetical protein JWM40_2876 [Frankiales bacterium]|nr:hypothetical protein [Frankiales bacterium]